MKIATWNVNGIRARAAQVCEFIEKEQPDVLCLQELKANVDQVPLECRVTDYHIYWHGSTMKAYSGVSLHIKDVGAAKPAFTHPAFDMESRIVAAEAGGIVFASVYVPNGGKDYEAKLGFMIKLAAWAKELHRDGRELVLCGDMNITRTDMDVHPTERKPGVIGQREEERELLDKLLAQHLVDVGRALDPDNPNLFTWWAPWRNLRSRNIGWRLDYVLASPTIAERAASCVVLADVGTSDHAPVVMTGA